MTRTRKNVKINKKLLLLGGCSMPINIILVVIGLIICFGGIYIKKISGFALGLGWGAIATFIVELAIGGFSLFYFLEMDEEELWIVLVGGLVFGILSAIYDKICVAISTFLSVFSLSTLLMLILDLVGGIYIYIVSAIVSFLLSFVSVKIYTYSYIFLSAITGSFIATIGGYGLYREIEFYDTIRKLIVNEEARLIMLASTLVLGLVGFIFQLYRFKLIERKKNKKEQTEQNQKRHKEISFDFKKITNSFLVKELKKNWLFYLISILFVCSDLHFFNGVLHYEILYLTVTAAIFLAFHSKVNHLLLWLTPMFFLLGYSVVNFLLGTVNIYIALEYLSGILTSEGIVILTCLLAKLISTFLKNKHTEITLKNSSLFSFSLVFLSFLIGYYSRKIRNNIVPSEPMFYISITKMILLSIEAIILFFIFYTATNIKHSSDGVFPVIKKNLKTIFPTAILLVSCFASVFAINTINDKIEENKYKTKYECYNEIIAVYSQAATQGINDFYEQQEYYSNIISDMLVNAYYNYGEAIAYTLHDIDNNGVKELIISNTEQIYDIYTTYQDQAVNLFPDENFGYRHFADILENGQIITYGSGGMSSALAEVYNIKDGYYVDIYEAYFYDDTDPSYFLNNGYTMLSEEEFDNKLNSQRKSSVLDSLKWTTLYEPIS